MASAPESPNISTWPSGAAFATMLAATTPPAPGTFSTMNGLPNAAVNFSASSRPITSGLPPGPAAAIRRTVRVGHASSCAAAGGAKLRGGVNARVIGALSAIARSRRGSRTAPHLSGDLDHQAQLLLLDLGRDRVAGIDAGKAALRADREIGEVDMARGLLDALAHGGLAFHGRRLGRDDAEHDGLVRRHQA